MSSVQVCLRSVHAESKLSFSCINRQSSDSSCSRDSILLYIAASGSTMPIRVLESDSIESVKLRIQTCKGILTKKQKLVCSGRELARNDSLIREYGVKDGDVLHLVIRVEDLKVINVRTYSGNECRFCVDKFRNVWYVKKQVAKKQSGGADDIVKDQQVACHGVELGDEQMIGDISSQENAVVRFIILKPVKVQTKSVEKNLELSVEGPKEKKRKRDDLGSQKSCEKEEVDVVLPIKPADNDSILKYVTPNPQLHVSDVVEDMIRQTFEGLTNRRCPIRSSDGTGGTYFMQNSIGDKIVSIFKPVDEEPNALNNPHGLAVSSDGEGLKKGTKVGEGAIREVAVYLLDHPKNQRRSFKSEEMGFAGVPPTSMIKCFHAGFNHPKECKAKFGSLQKFVENYGSCEEMGPGNFPVNEVHKISVLDIRMANADRHAGNILISKNEEGHNVLVPIDHGYCLPKSFEDCTFEWLYWPQARQCYSPETLKYIRSLDAEEDIATLKFYGWDLSQECARTLRVSTMLLKKGAEHRLSPYAIGSIMCRGALNKPSILEEILHEAQDSVLPSSSETAYLDSVSQIMDGRLAQILK